MAYPEGIAQALKSTQAALADNPTIKLAQEIQQSWSPVLTQLSDILRQTDIHFVAPEVAEALSKIAPQMNTLSNLQLVAVSKAISPALLELSDSQKKLRSSITREEAKSLVKSTALNADESGFTYKGDKISKEKVSTAIQVANLFDDITVDDVLNFSDVLYKYPYLSFNHEVGQRIFEESQNVDASAITEVGEDVIYYRARIMEDELTRYSESEMKKAPFKIPGQGRFNTHGVAKFYLAGAIDTAVEEVKKHSSKKGEIHIQVAHYQSQRSIQLFDLTRLNNALAKKCMKNVTNPDKFNADYLISGFLAQCLEYHGNLDGILYGTEENKLFVFFDDSNFRQVGCSFHTVYKN